MKVVGSIRMGLCGNLTLHFLINHWLDCILKPHCLCTYRTLRPFNFVYALRAYTTRGIVGILTKTSNMADHHYEKYEPGTILSLKPQHASMIFAIKLIPLLLHSILVSLFHY